MGHLTKLMQEYGKKGLNVLAITGEDKDLVLRYMTHNDANFGYAVGIGGASGYPSKGIPYSALIGPDGKVEYLGHPGSMSSKLIEGLLKKVPKKLSPEDQELRAAKILESAEKLIEDKQLLRAESILQRAAAKYGASESGKKAGERAKTLKDGDFKAEYDAQQALAKLVGGIEKPAEADSDKAMKRAKDLEKKAEEWKTTAPRAAQMAAEWAKVFATKWT